MSLREFADAYLAQEPDDSGRLEIRSLELESGLEAIDSRLVRLRRAPNQWVESAPEGYAHASNGPTLTPDMMEDLASRVAESLRMAGPLSRPRGDRPVPDETVMPPAEPRAEPNPKRADGMRSDSVISIRVRWPLFSFRPFRTRRRRHRMSA